MSKLLFLTLVLCSQAVAQVPSPQPPKEKIFTYCVEAGPQTFNPQLATDSTTYSASSRTIYNRLVDFDRVSTKILPGLAKSWVVSSDGKTVTFQLHENVSFHSTDYFKPTRKLNADDVLFSFHRMWDPKHLYHKVGGGKYPSFESQQMGDLIRQIVRVNDHSVKFVLKRSIFSFLSAAAN